MTSPAVGAVAAVKVFCLNGLCSAEFNGACAVSDGWVRSRDPRRALPILGAAAFVCWFDRTCGSAHLESDWIGMVMFNYGTI